MAHEKDRWIPTPEELEEGKRKRRQLDREVEDSTTQEKETKGFSLLRRLGVGRKRKYVKVDQQRSAPKTAQQKQTQPSDREGEGEIVEPLRPQVDRETEDRPSPKARRVESVSIPKRRKAAPEPKYPPYSREARFLAKATAKGHRMGELIPIPHTTNHSSTCSNCGFEGELVIQHEDRWADQTYELFRGPAIERRCPEQAK